MAAYTLAKVLGIKEKDIFNAVSGYRGAWRRMEYRGQLITHNSKLKTHIYDDYAHHPTEIKATLAGIAQKWPKTAIICVFQPHQAQRLSALFKEFTGAFDNADVLILLDIFKVKGRDNVSHNINSKKLTEAIKKENHPLPYYILKILKILKRNKNSLNSKSYILNSRAIIIMMGAGDIYKLTDKLIR